MAQIKDYKGAWKCTHWYPSNDRGADDFDEHEMKSYWDGDTLVLESVPDDSKSYFFVRLTIDDDIATGSWHETATEQSEYKGANYSGYGQLTVDPKTLLMEGKWAGAGLDRKLSKMRIYTGSWEIKPAQKL